MLFYKYIFTVLFLFTLGGPVEAAEHAAFAPWNFCTPGEANAPASSPASHLSAPAHLLTHGVKFFIHYISRVDGDRCQMYPTCSRYSLEAIETHGFFLGIIMTADRLIHESNEMDYAPFVQIGNDIRYLDPVSNNDFWWYRTIDLDKRPTVTKLRK